MGVRRAEKLHSSIISMIEVLKNFIKTRLIVKSRVCKVQHGSTIALAQLTATVWNSIPQNIRLLPSIGSFKRSLKACLSSLPG